MNLHVFTKPAGFICLLMMVVLGTKAQQGVNISSTPAAPDPSAGLEVDFSDKGFLLPRMTTTQRNAISNPAIGLQIYNTTSECLEVYHVSGWQTVNCRCSQLPNAAFTFSPGTPLVNVAATFNATTPNLNYQWSFQGGSPASSTAQNPSVTWANGGTYMVILTVTDNSGCFNSDTVMVTVVLTPPKNCLDILTANPGSPSGVYQVDPDGLGPLPAMNCYCDMVTDGGGWTLVMHDTHNGTLLTENINSQGTLTNLLSPTGGPAKYSDVIINTMKTNNNTSIGYMITSNNIGNRYFIASSCVYQHNSNNNNSNILPSCRAYVSTYTVNPSPTYINCINWGGWGAGIDLWYGCNGNGGYTNVANTHRNYSERSGITTNASGAILGSSGTTYGNDVLLWIK